MINGYTCERPELTHRRVLACVQAPIPWPALSSTTRMVYNTNLTRQKSRNIDRSSLQYPGKGVNPQGQKITVRKTPRGGTYEIISQPRNHIASTKSHRFPEMALHRIYEIQHDHSQGASTPASPNKHHPQKRGKKFIMA